MCVSSCHFLFQATTQICVVMLGIQLFEYLMSFYYQLVFMSALVNSIFIQNKRISNEKCQFVCSIFQ